MAAARSRIRRPLQGEVRMNYPAHRPDPGNGAPGGRQVVVGVDGSVTSVAALAWAAREARLRQAELRAVCVWEDTGQCRAPYATCQGVPSRAEGRAVAASLLSASVRAVFGPAPPPWLRTEVVDGRPEQVLPGRAAGSEMLVLGGSSIPTAPGPVHRACLHGASCPVAVVGCPTTAAPGGEQGGDALRRTPAATRRGGAGGSTCRNGTCIRRSRPRSR